MIDGAEVFLDTNILLYAALGREESPEKFVSARRIVLEEDYSTSGQVLAEFFTNVIRKGARPLSRDEALKWVTVISRKPCQPVDANIVKSGIEMSVRYKISYWDGAIVAAAERLGATTLYTEDFNHEQTYGSVTAINPFIET